MLFVEVTQMYTGVFLCNTIAYWQQICFVIDNSVKNKICQRNLMTATGIYCGLDVQTLQIRSDLTFLLYEV